MRQPILAAVITLVCLVSFGADKGLTPGQQAAIDAKRLRLLLPKMLRSSDAKLVHEALLIIRDDCIHNLRPSDELLSEVVDALRRLLHDRKREEAGTRRLACEIFWRARWKKAVPVLLEALDDPYEKTYFMSMGEGHAAHMEWYAVWKSADHALRELTGASPIGAPRQRAPIPGQREKVRKAWLQWYKKNAKPTNSVK